MHKINILPSEIYNKISAGEVVENPASIVKELVENSIDAGSNNITIDIVDGGITSVIISDNGCGISREYIKNAFLPHATSKIATDEDLEKISTLGFRGEALPSIASVCAVELRTKSVDDSFGVKYLIKGGKEIELSDIDCNNGTTIEVRNIFFNTPARQKFLKKPKTEEHEITKIVQGLILANPNISFKYIADGKVIFNSHGKGLENAMYSIYPTSITKHLVYVDYENDYMAVKGYISLPTLTKPNRNYQTTIINGRVIQNNTIDVAVSQAYGTMLMKRAFPVFCLDIIMPFDMLDVNVTPNKTDVRFVDNRIVFSGVYRAVQDTLNKNKNFFAFSDDKRSQTTTAINDNITLRSENINQNAAINFTDNSIIDNLPNSTNNTNHKDIDCQNNNVFEQHNLRDATNNSNFDSTIVANNTKNVFTENVLATDINQTENIFSTTSEDSIDFNNNVKEENASNSKTSELLKQFSAIKSDKTFTMPNNSAILKANDSIISPVRINEEIKQSTMFDEIEEEFAYTHKIIGQIFNTYLIVAKGECVYLIDQHATHERLIYDKLISQIQDKNIASQPLLTPQIIELSAIDYGTIANLIDEIRQLGFDIEEFGSYTFKINAIPIIFSSFDANKFINSLLQDKNKLSAINVENILHEEIAKKACKSAIKAGQKLKDIEIQELIKQIEENKPIQCPHGRPTIIKLTRKDIDKLFKRIL